MQKMLGDKKMIALFTVPALLVFTVIVFYPILQTLQKSFYDWDGLSQAVFSGIENYKDLFTDDLFYESLKNGIIFAAILVVFQMGLATLLMFALMNNHIPFKRFFRSSFFIPVVLSVTVACQLWSSIYDPEFGLLNNLFQAIGLNYQQNWLSDLNVAIIAVAL